MTVIRFDGYFMLKNMHFYNILSPQASKRSWCEREGLFFYATPCEELGTHLGSCNWSRSPGCIKNWCGTVYIVLQSRRRVYEIPAPCWAHTYVNISVNCCITNCYISQWWEFAFVPAVELTTPTPAPRRLQYIVGFAFWKHYHSLSAQCHSTQHWQDRTLHSPVGLGLPQSPPCTKSTKPDQIDFDSLLVFTLQIFPQILGSLRSCWDSLVVHWCYTDSWTGHAR